MSKNVMNHRSNSFAECLVMIQRTP
jgi:hypothetical protein